MAIIWGHCSVLVILLATAALAAGKQPAPAGAFEGAPPQYTRFSAAELQRGFLALAFGSDLRIGARPRGIRRFDHPIRARVIAGGSVDRAAAMQRVLDEYAGKVPNLHLSIAAGTRAGRRGGAADRRERISSRRCRPRSASRSPRPSSRAPIRNA